MLFCLISFYKWINLLTIFYQYYCIMYDLFFVLYSVVADSYRGKKINRK